nr:sialidase family protein [bacterium]
VSNNEGKTWSLPTPSGFSGTTHSLIPLADGRLLIAYTDCQAPFGIHIRVSEDSGRTWPDSDCRLLDDSSVSGDCGWTRGFQLDDGSVFLSYYVSGKKKTTTILGAVFNI